MKNKSLTFLVISFFAAAIPAVAAHNHAGSQNNGSHDSLKQQQSAKETEVLLDSCARKAESVQRRIDSLRSGSRHKDIGPMVEELKKLEQKLKDADEIARPLRLF